MLAENLVKKLVLAVFVLAWCVPSLVEAQSCTPTIGAVTFVTLQAAVDAAGTGATINVTGVCSENISIGPRKERIILDGQGLSTINGPDATSATLLVSGREITIKKFTISGGSNGILVRIGATATIDQNLIQGTGTHGIQVNQSSFAVIVNNTIQNNSGDGILVQENSAARIGFLFGPDPAASPNLIQNNGERGITVTRASNARIAGNTITGNVSDGIIVSRNSHADISDNVINGNGANGILVTRNAGVNLGNDTGTTFLDLPNSTTSNSTEFGIRCSLNSYANGRLGSLNGGSGPGVIFSPIPSAPGFSGSCINSLNP